MIKFCGLYAGGCLARAVEVRFADVWICAQHFLVSAVSCDPGELGFFPPLVSVRAVYSLAFVGLSCANLLAYWLRGTLFGVLDSAIHPDAFHYDWIGCVYAQLSLLNILARK